MATAAPRLRHVTRHDDILVATVREHAPSMLRVARRHSLCADDAQDAYQRALEIYLRKADTVRPDTVGGWLRTVVKHEAMAIRAHRQDSVDRDELDAELRDDARGAEDHVIAFDRVARAAEALARLKPQEAKALMLKAEGFSYQEIAERLDWTYTKVNRNLAEGRARFLRTYAAIESGAECERFVPVLADMAEGRADARALLEARPHLRRCASCRSTLRDIHGSGRAIAAVLPVSLLPVVTDPDHGGFIVRLFESVAGSLHERAASSVVRVQAATEALTSGKLAAVAASAAAVTGGGAVATEQAVQHHHRRAAGQERTAERRTASAAAQKRSRISTSRVRAASGADSPAPGARSSPPRGASAARTQPAGARSERAQSKPTSGSTAEFGGGGPEFSETGATDRGSRTRASSRERAASDAADGPEAGAARRATSPPASPRPTPSRSADSGGPVESGSFESSSPPPPPSGSGGGSRGGAEPSAGSGSIRPQPAPSGSGSGSGSGESFGIEP